MIRTGIYKLSQINDDILESNKKISITLYDKIQDLPKEEELSERILLKFMDDLGAYKRTYSKRFEQFDKEVLKILTKQIKKTESLVVEDIGVSDGRTAFDFFEKLQKVYSKISFSASDYNSRVLVIEEGNIKLTLSSNETPVEIVWPPFVFNLNKKSKYSLFYPLNNLILFFVECLVVQPLFEKYIAKKVRPRELFLVAPHVARLKKKDKRFSLKQHNVLDPFKEKEKADVVRAMNILNPSYFSTVQMDVIVKNTHDVLKKGGYLVTGSNQDAKSLVHGGVYQKTKWGFKKIWQSGAGCPVENHILKFGLENA